MFLDDMDPYDSQRSLRVPSWSLHLQVANFGSRAYTAGSAAIRPSMGANWKNPRTPCIIVLIEEARRPVSPRCRITARHGHAGLRPAGRADSSHTM